MSHSISNRRQFLTGRSVVREVEAIADGFGTEWGVDSTPTAESFLLHISRRAMACEFQIYLNAGQYPEGADAALEALDLIERLEDQMTVFRDHSEISQLNRQAASRPVIVEPRLFGLLAQAKRLHEATGGAFDITSGPLTKAWGFFRRQGRFPSADELAQALARVGSQWLELTPETRQVRYLKPGLEINLGAIGKGHALDRVAELLAKRGIADYAIHGGRSSILARGSQRSLPDGQRGWSVSLRHPLKPEVRLGEIWVRDRAIGTSGAANQFFHHQGKRYGHILDPRTGFPADRTLSTTVLAPTAAEADALATAFYVLGVEATIDFCQSRPELSVLLITAGERQGSLLIHEIGVADGEWIRYERFVATEDTEEPSR